MCGGVHYGEVEGMVSVERWSCSRGASCVVEYTLGRWRGWSYIVEWWRWWDCEWTSIMLERGPCSRGALTEQSSSTHVCVWQKWTTRRCSDTGLQRGAVFPASQIYSHIHNTKDVCTSSICWYIHLGGTNNVLATKVLSIIVHCGVHQRTSS